MNKEQLAKEYADKENEQLYPPYIYEVTKKEMLAFSERDFIAGFDAGVKHDEEWISVENELRLNPTDSPKEKIDYEAEVKKVYPDAWPHRFIIGNVYTIMSGNKTLGHHAKLGKAWQDAYNKLPPKPTEQ